MRTIASLCGGEILLEAEGAIGRLTLARPALRNALADRHWAALGEALAACEREGLRALILRGEGGAFSAGADLAELASLGQRPGAPEAAARRIQEVERRFAEAPLPTLAAIDGPCLGGGLGLALCCDARIATAESRFGLAPARLGLRYSPQDCARLVAAVGLNGARRLLLGEPIDAAEAQRIGLVDELVPPEGLERRARELAGHWLKLAPEAVAGIRRSLAALVESLARAAEPLWGEFYGAFRSEEFQEGVRAFLGKRPPRWSG